MAVKEKEKAVTVEQHVYELIKDRIMNLELKPGQFLNDQEIADTMNISRTPVRDAFRKLEFEGLLTSHARRGYQVSPLSLDDIREIFNIKEALQGMIANQAARCCKEPLREELRQAAEAMRTADMTADPAGWFAAHTRFHELLMAMSEYPDGRVNAILNNLNDQWRRIRKGLYTLEGYRARETQDHYEIAQAILACDPVEAEARTRRHLNRVQKELIHLLENLVFPFASNGI